MRDIFISAILSVVLLTGAVHAARADEYRILAIRVDFPYEDPDHETTSGRGIFDMDNYYTDAAVRERYYHPWDIPPHDSLYFAHHLTALDNYWRTVSENRVSLSFDIWPKTADGAYTMSKKFYKYGNGRSKDETNEKLVELFSEAVQTCKNTEGSRINFADYDTFMIIHAGQGQETSGGLNDIPSAFLSRQDFVTYMGAPLNIDGVSLDNGLIVPESTSTTGVGGLNGIMAQMFGHRLGLPSLSNNKDGLPAAGGWCLMDTGAMSWGYRTRGFIPTHPCIWSKIDLGWVEPVIVTSDTTLDIAATHISNGLPRALKIPLSGDEYLLIENRFRLASRDSLAHAVYSDTDSSGVWLSVDHYDAYIPGSGILIWHINDRIIREKRAQGAINDDPLRRGIDLLEGDGRQDIGAMYGFGDERAEYSEGHDDDTYKLDGPDVLSPVTNPDSGSMWGGWSGITVRVLSDPGEIMRVSVGFSEHLPGFPLRTGNITKLVTAADIDNNGADELIVSGGDSALVVRSDGSIAGDFPASGHPAVFQSSTTGPPRLAVPAGNELFMYDLQGEALTGSPISPPLSDGLDGTPVVDGNTAVMQTETGTWILCAVRTTEQGRTVKSSLYALNASDTGSRLEMELPDTTHVRFIASAGESISLIGENEGKYYLYTGSPGSSFTIRYRIETGHASEGFVMADIDRDNVYETVFAAGNEIIVMKPDGVISRINLSDTPVGAPVAADIDNDGYPEIFQNTRHHVYAFRKSGAPLDRFPLGLPPGDDDEIITSQPVIADLDGDGDVDIAFMTSDNRMVAFDRSGLLTRGFPRLVPGEVVSSPAIFRRASQDSIAAACITRSGELTVTDLMTSVPEGRLVWPMYSGGASLSSSLINTRIPSEIRTTAAFKFYCYPNPVTGGVGTFRFTPAGPTDCTISVYSADGRRVFECYLAENEIVPGVPNEVSMNAANLASGLYIARIKTRTNTVMYKLGVLK
ncbi:T9SS type A sorting domain-containing protein [bacterium]|nr:T9SS type A sorting domain-containing protein [bacterium]